MVLPNKPTLLQFAEKALGFYSVQAAELDLIQNNVFRVDPGAAGEKYLLKFYFPENEAVAWETRAITARMEWLFLLHNTTHLAVQTPVANLQGQFVSLIEEGEQRSIICTLQQWVAGD